MASELPLWTAPGLAQIGGIVHGFTSRVGGTSAAPFDTLNLATRVEDDRTAVLANRAAVLSRLGRPQAAWLALRQVHGDSIVQVTAQAGPNIEADGLWTRDRRAALAVLTADCLPLLVANPGGDVVAAVHAGWRGTQQRIGAALVAKLTAAGVAPATLRAALGPCIGPCCFEIGTEVAEALTQAFPEVPEALQKKGARWTADLWALNHRSLVDAGLVPACIDTIRVCTACDARFFSYRRDAKRTGRQAGVIALKN